MTAETTKPEERRPRDPLMHAADTALRRAAEKARERARAAAEPKVPPLRKTGTPSKLVMALTEDSLVQQTTACYLRDVLGWRSVYACNEESFGPEGTL